MSDSPDDTLHLWRCPVDGGALQLTDSELTWQGLTSNEVYPVLDGIPILVPDPGAWLAKYRDSVLATLAESRAVDVGSLAVISAMTLPWKVQKALFEDDWTSHEAEPDAPTAELPRPITGPGAASVRALLDVHAEQGLLQTMADWAKGQRPAEILELGPGPGLLTEPLSEVGRVVTADLSYRAAALSFQRGAHAAVVADVTQPAWAAEAFDMVVAANVYDIVDDPHTFLEGAVEALKPGGHLLLSTPTPAGLDELLDELGMTSVATRDGVPWVRAHSSREYQVFLTRLSLTQKPR